MCWGRCSICSSSTVDSDARLKPRVGRKKTPTRRASIYPFRPFCLRAKPQFRQEVTSFLEGDEALDKAFCRGAASGRGFITWVPSPVGRHSAGFFLAAFLAHCFFETHVFGSHVIGGRSLSFYFTGDKAGSISLCVITRGRFTLPNRSALRPPPRLSDAKVFSFWEHGHPHPLLEFSLCSQNNGITTSTTWRYPDNQ